MIDIFQKVKGRLIVSCQAEEGSPFNSPEGVGVWHRENRLPYTP